MVLFLFLLVIVIVVIVFVVGLAGDGACQEHDALPGAGGALGKDVMLREGVRVRTRYLETEP